MRFYKTRRYLGIKYQQTTLYGASLEEERARVESKKHGLAQAALMRSAMQMNGSSCRLALPRLPMFF